MKAQLLEKFKSQFEQEKADLVTRLTAIGDSKTRSKGAISADSSEAAVEIQGDEVVDRLEDIERNRLNQIEQALKRMEAGSYGMCSSCGNEISEARLNAMPAASVCMDCKQEEEE